ncbi:MAG TPA: magnesium/cobalt transporter CorA [Gaiellaceae bacterium]|nr:magnesium/cobalt transporter CorA [Gaiellaceae bacterium]
MIVDMAVYENGSRRPGKLELEDAYEACRDGKSFAWIELQEPTEEEFDSVLREFNLHELAVEDAIQAHQRPKLDVYDEGLLVVLKTARYIEPDERIQLGEILVFVGDGFIITVRHGKAALHNVRHRLEKRPELLRLGPAAALYAIVDDVVDDYGPVIAALEQDIAELEADVFSEERATPPKLIYAKKREVLRLYSAIAPLVDPLDRLEQGNLEIPEELRPYFRDVEDHLIRYMREVEGFRELLTSVLAANLTQVSVRQNEDVRKISAWAAIIAVPTLITGIYGMNFEHMPELGWTFGYPLTLAAMATACLLLYRYFKRAGWL